MKSINIFVAFLFIINISAQQPDPRSFFPSSVGNLWEYYGTRGFYRERITRDSIASDSKRYLFVNYFDKPFYLIDSFNVYTLSIFSLNPDPWLDYKLDAALGETWFVTLPDSEDGGTKAIIKYEYNMLVFNNPCKVKEIWYYNLAWGDTSIQYGWLYQKRLLASNFGLIAEYSENDEPYYLLRGCVINRDTFGILTNVPDENVLPEKFFLEQNFPNPFNNETTIKYSVDKESFVELKVYDLLGNEVAILVNERKTPGQYYARFSEKNLTSGIYIYRIISDTRSISRKMILLK